jgi:hypothetical protein
MGKAAEWRKAKKWGELRAAFNGLQRKAPAWIAFWQPATWSRTGRSWAFENLDHESSEDDSDFWKRFELLAERAAVLADDRPGKHTWLDWLDILRRESSFCETDRREHMNQAGEQETAECAEIYPMCMASAEVCYIYETRAIAEALQRSSAPGQSVRRQSDRGGGKKQTAKPTYPNRAAFVDACLRKRGWNKYDPARHHHEGRPDPKTVQKILDGCHVREDVLTKLAEALSTRRSKVNPEDIPND